MKGKGGLNASETSGAHPEAVDLAGWRAGKSLREIAVEHYGREQVDANWHADTPLRSKMQRSSYRAQASPGAGPGWIGPGTA